MASARIEINRAALVRMLMAKHLSPEWFSPYFLAKLPLMQLDTLLLRIRSQQGRFESVEVREGALYSVFQKSESKTLIATDSNGRITRLQFTLFVSRTSCLDEALQLLRSNSADSSYLIIEDNTQKAAFRADEPLAVGSAFKLAVLAALRAEIDNKNRSWSDVIFLKSDFKSLPSGQLQNWPNGAPITLATLATQMISISDNTAADALIHILGRHAVEAFSGHNRPFMTTRNMFVLRSNAELREAYSDSTPEQRRDLLRSIDTQPLPPVDLIEIDRPFLHLEWHFSALELCTLIGRVQDLDLMTVNQGFSNGNWRRMAYKGGTDAGIVNFTVYAVSASGKSFRVCATWNNSAGWVDETALASAFGSVLEHLSRE